MVKGKCYVGTTISNETNLRVGIMSSKIEELYVGTTSGNVTECDNVTMSGEVTMLPVANA
jgi:hypothetical protein